MLSTLGHRRVQSRGQWNHAPSARGSAAERLAHVPGVTGEDNPQPEDNTPSLSTDASMGVASHPEVFNPAGQDTQSAPVDAGVTQPRRWGRQQ